MVARQRHGSDQGGGAPRIRWTHSNSYNLSTGPSQYYHGQDLHQKMMQEQNKAFLQVELVAVWWIVIIILRTSTGTRPSQSTGQW